VTVRASRLYLDATLYSAVAYRSLVSSLYRSLVFLS
jgi:hypothetical protein